jgi:glycerate 2-kinase
MNGSMAPLVELLRGMLAALHPDRLLPAQIEVEADALRVGEVRVPLDGCSGVSVLGLGKAAVAQVRAMRRLLIDQLPDGFSVPRGFAVTRLDHGRSDADVEVVFGSHPYPDDSSCDAASALLERAAQVPSGHLMVFCLSGGGSALACSPRTPFTFADKLQANVELLRSGASITETNIIRREMSALKNGSLLASAGAERVLTLVTSDVPDSDLAFVSSGPTIHRALDPELIRTVARARLSPRLAERIEKQLTSPERRHWNAHLSQAVATKQSWTACVGDYNTLLRTAHETLHAVGFDEIVAFDEPCNEPIERGIDDHLATLAQIWSEGGRFALLSGGELPVRVHGPGNGGRNTEFVARMAKALFVDRLGAIPSDLRDRVRVLAVGTDGSDGPTDAAGGHLSAADVRRGEELGLSIEDAIARNDTLTYLDRIGCAIRTGPTDTNLMDLRMIVLCPFVQTT